MYINTHTCIHTYIHTFIHIPPAVEVALIRFEQHVAQLKLAGEVGGAALDAPETVVPQKAQIQAASKPSTPMGSESSESMVVVIVMGSSSRAVGRSSHSAVHRDATHSAGDLK